jgi:hypothetical protein
MSEAPSALVPIGSNVTSANSTLRVLVKTPGSEVLVFPYRDDPENYPDSAALLRCQTTCRIELPRGHYSLRVVTSDAEVSYADFTLNSARWVAVAPAQQVTRDVGFTLGLVGAVATVLGGAMLGELICDSCSKTTRKLVGGLSLGLGIPMLGLGASMYVAYRKASVEDQVYTQSASCSRQLAIGATWLF